MYSVYAFLLPLLRRALFVFALGLPLALPATRYVSLQDGNYSNTSTVWSTDGAAPCLCTPGDTLDQATDTVDVRHAIALDTSLTLQNGAVLRIMPGATLIGSRGLQADLSAQIQNDGILQVQTLDLLGFAMLSSGNSLSVTGDFLLLDGFANLSGTVFVGGNVLNQPYGFIVIMGGTQMQVNGHFLNDGITVVEAGACLTVNGNFVSNYVVGGDGHISTLSDLVNAADWAGSLTWCAAGIGTGLPTAPTCTGCGPLPVTLKSFGGRHLPEEGLVEIEWETLVEAGNSSFILTRSADGVHFEALAGVGSKAEAGMGAAYAWSELALETGSYWYRLSQVDANGIQRDLGSVRVEVKSLPEFAVKAWPNPCADQVHCQVLSGTGQASLTVRGMDGRVVAVQECAGVFTEMAFSSADWAAGMYLIEVQSGTEREILRMTKQ